MPPPVCPVQVLYKILSEVGGVADCDGWWLRLAMEGGGSRLWWWWMVMAIGAGRW